MGKNVRNILFAAHIVTLFPHISLNAVFLRLQNSSLCFTTTIVVHTQPVVTFFI